MTKNSEMEAKAAILDKCCQSVECLARGKVFDLVGTLDLPQSSSPETELVNFVANAIYTANGLYLSPAASETAARAAIDAIGLAQTPALPDRETIAKAIHARRYHMDAKDTASMFAWYAENPAGTDRSRMAIHSALQDADAVLAVLSHSSTGREGK